MKLILTEDISSLGKGGDLVDVADGYGRNFLLPQKKAILATPSNLKALEHQRRILQQKGNKIKKEAEKLAKRLEEMSLTILKLAGEEDKLFGAVTSMDIEEKLKESGVEIDRKKIILEDAIKSLGVHAVLLKLHPEVSATLKISVEKA